MERIVLGICLALVANGSTAGELVGSVGGTDISMDSAKKAGVAELSYRISRDDFADTTFAPEINLSLFDFGYAFIGLGGSMRQDLSGPWFAEAGLQAGAVSKTGSYSEADFAVRGSVSIGREVTDTLEASLGYSRIEAKGLSLDSITFRLHLKM